jgi:hypothetical protein
MPVRRPHAVAHHRGSRTGTVLQAIRAGAHHHMYRHAGIGDILQIGDVPVGRAIVRDPTRGRSR